MKTKLLRKIRKRFVIYKSGKGEDVRFTLHDRRLFFGYTDLPFYRLSDAMYVLRERIRMDYKRSEKTKVWFK